MVECLRNTDIKVKIPLKYNSFQGSLKKTPYVDTLKTDPNTILKESLN